MSVLHSCSRNCHFSKSFGPEDSSTTAIHNERSGQTSIETTEGFPHSGGKMSWGSAIQDEDISTSLLFAFVSSAFPLLAACLARPLNPPRQLP
ncbi:hypothetical protein V8C34DRAFT_288989 [Trichoderma compactum]